MMTKREDLPSERDMDDESAEGIRKYQAWLYDRVLSETTQACEECPSSDDCPEMECPIYRVENIFTQEHPTGDEYQMPEKDFGGRKNRISWDEMYFEIAEAAAKRSSDPKTQVGACLVKDRHVIGVGYNGAPRGFKLDFRWDTEEKYDYVIHAEMNAIANANAIGVSSAGAEIYLTHSPCAKCILLLIQNRIKAVHFRKRYSDYEKMKKIADASDIVLMEDRG